MPEITALDHLVLTVADIEATVRFYADVLGMRAETFAGTDGTTRTAVVFGSQKINLHQAGAEFAPHAARPLPGTADLCFLTDDPVGAWQARIEANGMPIEAGPVRRTGATGPILSVYLRDPDGNLIEIGQRLSGAAD